MLHLFAPHLPVAVWPACVRHIGCEGLHDTAISTQALLLRTWGFNWDLPIYFTGIPSLDHAPVAQLAAVSNGS